MLHQTVLFLGQLWQLFYVSQILEFLRYISNISNFLLYFRKGNNSCTWLFASMANKSRLKRGALLRIYRIYLAVRRGFHLSRMTTNN